MHQGFAVPVNTPKPKSLDTVAIARVCSWFESHQGRHSNQTRPCKQDTYVPSMGEAVLE
jgi:hypothetical protein